MKFISWNVNGFRACLNKGFGDFFSSENADFFSIQESKMQPGQAEFNADGYYQYWYSAEKKGYSGTAVFTKHEPISVKYGLGIDEHDHEGRAITLEYENFYLLNVYTPNSQRELTRLDYRMTWEDALRNYMMELDKDKPVIYCGDLKEAHLSYISTLAKKKPVILCGDLNVAAAPIDLRNPKSNERSAGYTIEERAKFQELLQAGFIDTFRYMHPDKQEFSWWSYMYRARENNIGWRIDYFLVSEELKDKIKVAKIYTDVYGSDHAPILLEIEV